MVLRWLGRQAEADQYLVGLVQRQPHDVGVGAVDEPHEGRRPPLYGVAAGLAPPFVAGEVGRHLLCREPLEGDGGAHEAARRAARRVDHRDPAIDPVAPAGEEGEAAPRALLALRLVENPPAARHHRVGAEDERAGVAGRDGLCLGVGEPGRVRLRQLAGEHRFVERRRLDDVRRIADLLQQRAPAGRRRGEHQGGRDAAEGTLRPPAGAAARSARAAAP